MNKISVEDMCKEILEKKHSEINLFFMEKQKIIKGYIKNVTLTSENEEKSLDFSMQEIKDDEQMLEKHSCKKKGCEGGGGSKERMHVTLNGIEELVSIEKNSLPDKLTYKLDFGDETIGVVVKL